MSATSAAADSSTAAIQAWIHAWATGEACDADFTQLARQRFDAQLAAIAAFRAYGHARGFTAAGESPWQTLPLVPVSAFKRAALHTRAAQDAPVARFETSGTTDGQPGVVQLADTSLYDLSLRASFHHFVVPDAPLRLPPARTTPTEQVVEQAAGPFRVISLVPDRQLRPHSSLGHMVEVIGQTWADGPVRWLLTAQSSAESAATGPSASELLASGPSTPAAKLNITALQDALEDACNSQTPVLLLTTSIALQLLVDAWPQGRRLSLPPSSRVMDTGGPKGRRIQLSRSQQHAWLAHTFALPPHFIIGELGMTELCSQRYETVTRAALCGDIPASRLYVAPPWLRSVVLDPQTLAPLSHGTVGLIGHVDLANVDTCAFILTGDLGHLAAVDGTIAAPDAAGKTAVTAVGLALQGRAPGNPWRGCGLDVEALFS